MKNEPRQPYNSPRFERYGNVRDLTSALANNKSSHLDGISNSFTNAPGKTH